MRARREAVRLWLAGCALTAGAVPARGMLAPGYACVGPTTWLEFARARPSIESVEVLPPSVARLVELARAGGHELEPPLVRSLVLAAELLALLPLERAERLELTPQHLVLVFDEAARAGIEVAVPERPCYALDPDDELDPLRDGRAVRMRGDARRLRLNQRLRFEIGPQGLDGLVTGDIEVLTGPFDFDLEVRIEHRPRAVARDKFGRALLALDARGKPRKHAGRWIVLRHDDWLVMEAMGQRVELGLGAPCADEATAAQAAEHQ